MRIRAITLGLNLQLPLQRAVVASAAHFLTVGRQAFEEAGFAVQTTRLATQPLADLLGDRPIHEAVAVATAIERACNQEGIEYISLGTLIPEAARELLPLIPDIIAATEMCFLSTMVASRAAGIDLPAIRETGRSIKRIGETTARGFGNARFAALANCPPHIPFFPGAYHLGERARFTLALEGADVVQGVFDAHTPLEDLRLRGVDAVQRLAARIEVVAGRLAAAHGVTFGGLDFSTAPFPVPEISAAGALERLGLEAFGAPGTLFAAAFTADILRRSRFTKAGYCGVFLPILEDAVLAERNAAGTYTLESLLLCAAVCGTGLDTIPLPGDITAEELASIVLDVATLAVALDKPLTARLFPIPGKRAGELTGFDFPYFADTRILAPKRRSSRGILQREEIISLTPR